MRAVHIDPEEAVRAHLDLGATTSVGMHHGTFKQADDGYEEPVRDLAKARASLGVGDAAFRTLELGRALAPPR